MRLKVSLPSVTEMIRKLADKGLVRYERYGLVELTSNGRAIAKNVYSIHNSLTEFFLSIGVDKKTALHDACLVEHVLSKKTLNRIKAIVN